MAKLNTAQKRRQKELKRRKKKQLQAQKQKNHTPVAPDLSGLPKLSETLLEFAGGLLDIPNASRDYIESTIGMVSMCWNIGIVEKEQGREMRQKLTNMLRDDTIDDSQEDFESQFDAFIMARRLLYRNDPRFIVDYSVTWDYKDDLHLQIASTILPEDSRFSFDEDDLSCGLSASTQKTLTALSTPLTDEQRCIVEWIDEGYKLLDIQDKHSVGAACDLWLNAWPHVKALYKDTASIDEILPLEELFLSNWCTDVEMHLHNAGVGNPDYFNKRIVFCRDFCEQFPSSHPQTLHNMRRAEAEALFFNGQHEQGEAAFEALVNDYPDTAWGYIGWGDMYSMGTLGSVSLPTDIDRARALYRIPIERQLEDAEDAEQRLKDLEQHEAPETLDA
ncbi:hypothetical protein GCM10023116_04980 [Kistimonas scapharcae]|uniref:DUF1186 domain-containing protein n=1 Tax=Kistimonas scapharcae TaxID=1036133 RepID=A0ABP8UZ50_9GAMM